MEASKLFYSMGEVAEMFDVNPSLIRYWESQFDILRPKKNKKGNRMFSPRDLENLRLIYHLVKEKGMTLEGARKTLRGGGAGLSRDAELLERLQRVRAMLVEVREELKAGDDELIVDASVDAFDAPEPAAAGETGDAQGVPTVAGASPKGRRRTQGTDSVRETATCDEQPKAASLQDDEPVGSVGMMPAEAPVEGPAETPAEMMSVEAPVEGPTEPPAEMMSVETPVEGPAEPPAEMMSVETPVDGPTETPAEMPTETPAYSDEAVPAAGADADDRVETQPAGPEPGKGPAQSSGQDREKAPGRDFVQSSGQLFEQDPAWEELPEEPSEDGADAAAAEPGEPGAVPGMRGRKARIKREEEPHKELFAFYEQSLF